MQTSDHIFHNLRSFEIKTQTIYLFLIFFTRKNNLKSITKKDLHANMVVNSQCVNGLFFEILFAVDCKTELNESTLFCWVWMIIKMSVFVL